MQDQGRSVSHAQQPPASSSFKSSVRADSPAPSVSPDSRAEDPEMPDDIRGASAAQFLSRIASLGRAVSSFS